MWRWRMGKRLGLRMLHNGPETLEELVERHVVNGDKGSRIPSAGLTTSRREALALYREILRATRLFTWSNEQGVPWRDLLRESTRQEYEQARYETDPEVIARLLVVGRDAVQAALDKFAVKREELLKKEYLPHTRARPDRREALSLYLGGGGPYKHKRFLESPELFAFIPTKTSMWRWNVT